MKGEKARLWEDCSNTFQRKGKRVAARCAKRISNALGRNCICNACLIPREESVTTRYEPIGKQIKSHDD